MLERGSLPGAGRGTAETRRVEKRLQPTASAQRAAHHTPDEFAGVATQLSFALSGAEKSARGWLMMWWRLSNVRLAASLLFPPPFDTTNTLLSAKLFGLPSVF